jgi:hypothetical protein
LPLAVILPSTVPGSSVPLGDGDRLAGVVAEGFPDEEAAGVRASIQRGHGGHPFSLKVRATISPQGRAAEERPGCG